ncbi:MAG: hypothetical protein H0T76_09735 [Nannocystis sp.]|nr:hypothetical protein [Nannocystis sp.]MBA3546750.1 hypothetical protein [Nannocystis sp.]
MTDPAPSIPPSPEDPQGSLGAVLIGGAILLIAGLFIFWPKSETATADARTQAAQSAAAQGSNSVADGAAGGVAQGIDPRDIDPARARTQVERSTTARVTPGLLPATGMGMAPPRPPTPEPTSFASKAEEIAYVEKKLAEARADLDSRATFVERMAKIQQKSTSVDEDERNAGRAKVVKQNYENARLRVEELEKRLKSLKDVKL